MLKTTFWANFQTPCHCVFQLDDDAIDFCDEKILCKSFFLNFFYVEKTMNSHNGNICQNKKVLFQIQIWIRDFFDAFRLADAPSAIFLVFLLTFCSALECFVYIFLCGAAVSSSCRALVVLRDEFSCCQSFCICRPPKLSLGQPVWHELCSLIGTSYYQDAIEL